MPDLAAGGGRGIRKPDQRDTEESEVGVHKGNSFVESDGGVGNEKLPGRPRRIANGDPGPMDKIQVSGKALDGAGSEP